MGDEAIAQFKAQVQQLAALCEHVNALRDERDRLRIRVERQAFNERALERKQYMLQAIVDCCNKALGPKGKSELVERIRSLAQNGLDAGNEVT